MLKVFVSEGSVSITSFCSAEIAHLPLNTLKSTAALPSSLPHKPLLPDCRSSLLWQKTEKLKEFFFARCHPLHSRGEALCPIYLTTSAKVRSVAFSTIATPSPKFISQWQVKTFLSLKFVAAGWVNSTVQRWCIYIAQLLVCCYNWGHEAVCFIIFYCIVVLAQC